MNTSFSTYPTQPNPPEMKKLDPTRPWVSATHAHLRFEIDAVIHSRAFHAVSQHYAEGLVIYMSVVPKAFGDLSSIVSCC